MTTNRVLEDAKSRIRHLMGADEDVSWAEEESVTLLCSFAILHAGEAAQAGCRITSSASAKDNFGMIAAGRRLSGDRL